MKRKILALFCGLLGTCKIFAASPLPELALASEGESAFFSELPMVLTVTRMPQAMKDVPGFVTVIEAEEIRHSGARDLAELLRRVPGFNVAVAPGGAPGATYHGLGEEFSKGLQVLVDGRSQFSPLFEGGVVWNLIDVPLADIARIEVLRGSNSPAYGSNAFMGVVNIVTRHAAETTGAMASFSEGDLGIRDRYARFGFGNAGWNGRLSAEKTEDDGLANFDDSRITERYNVQIDANPGNNDSLKFAAGLLRLSQRRGEMDGDVLDPPRWVDGVDIFGQINWAHHWSQSSLTEVSLNHVRQTTTDVVPLAVSVFTSIFSNTGVAERDEFSLQHTFLMPTLRILGGLSYRSDTVNHDFYYGPGRELTQWTGRTFGQLEWRPNELATVNLGATYEDDSFSGDVFLPRLALNLHVLPDHTLKLIAGKSRRNPTIFEMRGDQRLYQTESTAIPVGEVLFVDRSSTGSVRPTEVLSKEIGYFGELKQFGLTLDARYFREDVTDLIRTAQVHFPDPNAPLGSPNCPYFNATAGGCGVYNDFFNVIDAKITGWETQIVWRPARTTELGLSFAQTRIDAEWILANEPTDPAVIRFIEGSAPRHSASVWGRQRLLDRITVSGAYYQVDAMRWTRNSLAAEYHRFDWRVAYEFKLGPAKAEVAWTVRSDGGDHVESRGLQSNGVVPWRPPERVGTLHFATLRLAF